MRWLVLVVLMFGAPVYAVEPSEVLDDKGLEDRARGLSQLVRCPVCQNESIDESHAPVARELRIIIRERLIAGDSDQEVMNYLSARFGEFVLLTPDRTGANLILWFAAPAVLLLGTALAFSAIRKKDASAPDKLTDDEKAEVDKILRS